MAVFFAKPPAVAGEPIANLMFSHQDRSAINGSLFKLDKRIEEPDKAMNDEAFEKRMWDELILLTELIRSPRTGNEHPQMCPRRSTI